MTKDESMQAVGKKATVATLSARICRSEDTEGLPELHDLRVRNSSLVWQLITWIRSPT